MSRVSRSDSFGQFQLLISAGTAENKASVFPLWEVKDDLWCFMKIVFFVKNELINMVRAWDKEKNLSPRQESKP